METKAINNRFSEAFAALDRTFPEIVKKKNPEIAKIETRMASGYTNTIIEGLSSDLEKTSSNPEITAIVSEDRQAQLARGACVATAVKLDKLRLERNGHEHIGLKAFGNCLLELCCGSGLKEARK